MKRCFVALPVPAETVAVLEGWQQRIAAWLVQRGDPAPRPTPAANLHLTLKFMGPVADVQLAAVKERLAAVAAVSRLPEVRLAGLGAFPGVNKARAVFADVRAGRDAVNALAAAIDNAVADLGFAPETRPRAPHVTLLRGSGKSSTAVAEFLRDAPRTDLGSVDNRTLVLYESTLQLAGSIYTPLATFSLGAT